MEKCTSTDNEYVGTSYKTRKKIQCMEGFHRNSNIYIYIYQIAECQIFKTCTN